MAQLLTRSFAFGCSCSWTGWPLWPPSRRLHQLAMDLGGVPWERDRSVNLASPSSNAVNDAFDLLFSELICVNIARSGHFQPSKVADARDDYWLTSARQRLSSEYPR